MTDRKTINLALQGGGAHGAFTWGVIDRILEDERLEIAAISGTSAGAMNAVVAADGLVRGGREAAREKLESFWRAVSVAGMSSLIRRSWLDRFQGNWSLDHSPGFMWMDVMTRFWAPGQFNPMRLNPLRDILVEHVDFENVCGCQEMKVFVAATNVETGQVRVFDRSHLCADMVMASACLPFLFEAVEIDGVSYWDGGYTGNPPLHPLYRRVGMLRYRDRADQSCEAVWNAKVGARDHEQDERNYLQHQSAEGTQIARFHQAPARRRIARFRQVSRHEPSLDRVPG